MNKQLLLQAAIESYCIREVNFLAFFVVKVGEPQKERSHNRG